MPYSIDIKTGRLIGRPVFVYMSLCLFGLGFFGCGSLGSGCCSGSGLLA